MQQRAKSDAHGGSSSDEEDNIPISQLIRQFGSKEMNRSSSPVSVGRINSSKGQWKSATESTDCLGEIIIDLLYRSNAPRCVKEIKKRLSCHVTETEIEECLSMMKKEQTKLGRCNDSVALDRPFICTHCVPLNGEIQKKYNAVKRSQMRERMVQDVQRKLEIVLCRRCNESSGSTLTRHPEDVVEAVQADLVAQLIRLSQVDFVAFRSFVTEVRDWYQQDKQNGNGFSQLQRELLWQIFFIMRRKCEHEALALDMDQQDVTAVRSVMVQWVPIFRVLTKPRSALDTRAYMYITQIRGCRIDPLAEWVARVRMEDGHLGPTHDAMVREHQELKRKYTELNREVERLRRNADVYEHETQTSASKIRKLESCNQTLADDNQTLVVTNQTLVATNQTLTTDNETLTADNQTLLATNETLSTVKDHLSRRNKLLQLGYQRISSHNTNLQAQIQEMMDLYTEE